MIKNSKTAIMSNNSMRLATRFRRQNESSASQKSLLLILKYCTVLKRSSKRSRDFLEVGAPFFRRRTTPAKRRTNSGDRTPLALAVLPSTIPQIIPQAPSANYQGQDGGKLSTNHCQRTTNGPLSTLSVAKLTVCCALTVASSTVAESIGRDNRTLVELKYPLGPQSAW